MHRILCHRLRNACQSRGQCHPRAHSQLWLIEGESRWEIAARRETSAQTVACQVRGIFSKWRLTGRYALIRRAVDLGWFR